MGYPPSRVLELQWWEAVVLCEAIDCDRAQQNLDTYTALGMAFGSFEKADAQDQLDYWRSAIAND